MAVPKKRTSRSKKRIRKNVWIKKRYLTRNRYFSFQPYTYSSFKVTKKSKYITSKSYKGFDDYIYLYRVEQLFKFLDRA